jgi:hypothetical protein
MAVIDGKQRVTTILDFLDGNLVIPAEWVGGESGMVTFLDLPKPAQRSFRHTACVQICEGRLENLEQEELVFELVNFGGVPQGKND